MPLTGRDHWLPEPDQPSNWVDDLLRQEGTIGPPDAARLESVARQEFGVAADPGARFSQRGEANEFDLVPPVLRTRGAGTVERFFRLEAADPLRTEVLCYLATRDTLKWLEQHYPPDRLETMTASGNYGAVGRADVMRLQLAQTTAARELRCLENRHPGFRPQIEELIESITAEEIQAFRRVLELELHEYPNRS